MQWEGHLVTLCLNLGDFRFQIGTETLDIGVGVNLNVTW